MWWFPRNRNSRLGLACAFAISVFAAGAHAQGDDGALEEEGTTAGGPKQKVLAVPYQAIFRSVPQEKLEQATALLHKELGGSAEVIRGAAGTEGAAETDALAQARRLSEEASAAEANKQIELAIELRKKSLSSYEANASAISDGEEYLFTHHLLARALKTAGRDKEAQSALDVVARMNPGLALPSDQFDRLYRAWFKKAVEAAMKEKRGEILVESALPGAAVELDGREMDVAPVVLEKVLPGRHLVVARIEGVAPFGAIVEVAAGKQTKVVATYAKTAGGSDVGRAAEAVSRNEIPKEAVESASRAGKEVGADFVVLGAMVRNQNDDKFRVHTFLVSVQSQSVLPMEQISFDLDFLTAESDVLRIVRSIQGAMEKKTKGSAAIAKIDDRVRGSSTVNRVDASPDLLAAAGAKERRRGVEKTKDGKRPVFRPLKGGSLVIKDEEE